jgi:hypothetical protein
MGQLAECAEIYRLPDEWIFILQIGQNSEYCEIKIQMKSTSFTVCHFTLKMAYDQSGKY